MSKAVVVATLMIMVASIIAIAPLYLWLILVQHYLGKGKLGFSAYMLGIILSVVLFYVMMS